MHNWFEVKVTYEKILENGMQGKVTESYLFDALSYTEAEARAIEEMRPFISGEFTISDIKRARISELFFNENGDRFYKIKVYFITLDEKSGSERKTAATMMAQASTLKEAIAILEGGMKGTMADYVIASVIETQLVDVYPYFPKKEETENSEEIKESEYFNESDEFYKKAVRLVRKHNTASVPLFVSCLFIGFNNAEKLMKSLTHYKVFEIKEWIDEFTDEDTGESTTVNRREIIVNPDYKLPE